MSEIRCTRLAEIQDAKITKKLPCGHHRTTLSRYIFAIKACIDNPSPQYSKLRPTNGWDLLVSLRHPANFNRFRVLASLLHRRRSTVVNKTLQDVSPSPALVYYICILGALTDVLPHAKFTLRPCLAFSYIDRITARHSTTGSQPIFVAMYKEWNYRTFADGATYIRLGGHHVGHRPIF